MGEGHGVEAWVEPWHGRAGQGMAWVKAGKIKLDGHQRAQRNNHAAVKRSALARVGTRGSGIRRRLGCASRRRRRGQGRGRGRGRGRRYINGAGHGGDTLTPASWLNGALATWFPCIHVSTALCHMPTANMLSCSGTQGIRGRGYSAQCARRHARPREAAAVNVSCAQRDKRGIRCALSMASCCPTSPTCRATRHTQWPSPSRSPKSKSKSKSSYNTKRQSWSTELVAPE
jgi:hypothetical protein